MYKISATLLHLCPFVHYHRFLTYHSCAFYAAVFCPSRVFARGKLKVNVNHMGSVHAHPTEKTGWRSRRLRAKDRIRPATALDRVTWEADCKLVTKNAILQINVFDLVKNYPHLNRTENLRFWRYVLVIKCGEIKKSLITINTLLIQWILLCSSNIFRCFLLGIVEDKKCHVWRDDSWNSSK